MIARLLALSLLAGVAACQPSSAEPTEPSPFPVVDESDREAAASDEATEGEATAQADEPASQPTSMPSDGHDHDHDHDHDHGDAEPHADGVGGTPPNMGDAETRHYGAPFASDADPITLGAALESCADTGEACKVTATVERVCQARGCWFTLTAPDVDPTVRVRMVDYAFFVPRNAVGATAVFEGTLQRTQISQEQAQHYADDEAAAGTAPPRTVTGPEDTYQFMITGVEMTRM